VIITTFVKVVALCIAIGSLYKLFGVQLFSNLLLAVWKRITCSFFNMFVLLIFHDPIAAVTALLVHIQFSLAPVFPQQINLRLIQSGIKLTGD